MTEPDEHIQGSPRDIIHSVQRGLSLTQHFDSENPALTLDQLAHRSGISRSATRRLMATLIYRGYAAFDGHRYSLTPRLLDLGYSQQSRLTIAEVSEPHGRRLSDELHRNVSVATLERLNVIFVLRFDVRRIMSVSLNVGSRLPAHLTAIGRALLAWLSEDELRQYLATTEFPQLTPRSITQPEKLRASLLEVRSRGWSVVDQEVEQGLSAVAVPIHDRRGQTVAAINVSFLVASPDVLAAEIDRALPALQRTAARIGAEIHPAHLA